MLKLEMVRFHYTDALTIGVLYDRAGWLCYTLESPLRTIQEAVTNQRVLSEGLYSLRVNDGADWRLRGVEVSEDGKKVNCRLCAVNRPHEVKSDIAVGYSADLFTGQLDHTDIALEDIRLKVVAQHEAFISVRHMDGTLQQHMERLRQVSES